MKHSHNSNILLVLTGAVLISFSGVWVKTAHVSPTSSAFYRVFFGFVFLLAASLWKHEFRRLQISETLLIILCGILFALDLFCWHRSIALIGPGLATILGNFQVFILTVVGFLFFKEKFQARFILSIPLAFSGLLLVIGTHWNELEKGYQAGIYYGILTALLYSGFLLNLRKIASSGPSFSLFYALMLVSLATSFFLGLEILFSNESFHIPDLQSWLSLGALGLFSQTIGWVLISTAMPKIPASYTGLILLLQPTLAFLWDVLFFKRQTDVINWLGVILVLTAIYMGISSSQKK